MTTQRSTLAANWAILRIGRGWVKPSLSTLASGAASRACMKEMPEVMMPRDLPPGTTRFSAQSSFHSAISESFWRNRRWAGRAWPGTITRAFKSRTKLAALGVSRPGRGPHHGATVANPRGGAKQDGNLPALGNLDGGAQEIVSLLGVGRLEHGHAGGDGVTAVVLFVLAGVHARIIGGNDDQGAGHSGVGDGEERVGGDVQADVFHGGHGARAAKGRADGDLQRDFFVGGPLGAAAQLGKILQDFGRGRAGIAGAEGDARVPARRGRWLRPRLTRACFHHP